MPGTRATDDAAGGASASSDSDSGESSAARRAYFAVIQGVSTGEFRPGSRLREESLAETLEMSRTPVREALRRLAAEGLVDLSRNRGARISSWSAREVNELFDLRVILEGYAARLAALNAEDDDIVELKRVETLFEEAVNDVDQTPARTAELNNQFHGVLAGATKNRQLVQMLSRVAWAPVLSLTFVQYRTEDHQRSINHHRELIEAVSRHDPEWAELAMRIHIRSTKSDVLRLSTEHDAEQGTQADGPLHWPSPAN